MRNAGSACFVSLLFFFVLAPGAVADEWSLSAVLDQGIEYDDNINMSTEPAAVFGYLMRPGFNANWNTAHRRIGITGNAEIRRYDDERWDCENFSLGLNQQYLRKRHVFSIPFQYSQSCSYSQQDIDTGVLVPNNTSENYSLSPSWSWEWTARDQLSLNLSYTQTNYTVANSGSNTQSAANFRNNDTYSLNFSEQHLWTRRLSSTASLFFSRSEFTSAGITSAQNVFGFQLAGQYAITRLWSVNGGGGFRWVQQPSSLTQFSEANNDSLLRTEVANLALNYNGQRSTFSVDYSRTVSPSAAGQVLEYNAVNLTYNYKINRELSFNVNASVQQNEAVGQSQNQSAQSRTFYSLSPRLNWNFARDWQMTASYRYRRQEYSGDGELVVSDSFSGTRNSHAIMLHINYNWDGFRASRSKPIN